MSPWLLMKKNDSLHLGNFEKILEQLVRDVCEAVDSPKSLAIWLLFINDEHNQLLEVSADPLHYQNSHRFADDYLVCSFLSKFPGLKLGIDTKEVAMSNFHKFESICAKTNRELYHRLHSHHERNNRIFTAASEKCKRWLPKITASVMSNIFNDIGWGPGVTSASKGSALSAYNKLQARLDATSNLIAVGAHYIVNSIPAWSTYHGSGEYEGYTSVLPAAFTAVPGNTVTTVPKNAKTDRTIAVEPHVNAAFQRGIGRFIRSILLRKGCDLADQSRNQRLAREGSVDDSLATLDLQGASDTVSTKLLELMLPSEWVALMNAARSPRYWLDNQWHHYHKHSSMGNGYTFELETLVFYTLALSACEEVGASTENVSVYGDDIIVPREAYEVLVEVLAICGFAVNEKKSFSNGPFRESCGADYFRGFNVRPFYVREKITSVDVLYRIANNLRRYAAKRNIEGGYDARFRKAWMNLFLSCPKNLRYRCPDGFGDSGFVSELDESSQLITVKMTPFGLRYRGRGLSFVGRQKEKGDDNLKVASSLMALERVKLITYTRVLPEKPSHAVKHVASEPPVFLPGSVYTLRDVGQWRSKAMVYDHWPFVGGWV